MIRAIVTKPFRYIKVHPKYEVVLGIVPADGMVNHMAKRGQVMEFHTIEELQEMQEIAMNARGKLEHKR